MLIAALITGCSPQSSVNVVTTAPSYAGALRTDYENALGTQDQFALGILKLEDTADAVIEEQALALLPLWQALQGTALQSQSERNAVIKQIESTLTEAQVAAIADMHLTEADAQTWLQSQSTRASGGFPRTGSRQSAVGGMGANMSEEDQTAMRERFQNMSDEERAKMREQFMQQQGISPAAATNGVSAMLTRVTTALLFQRSGQTSIARIRPQHVEPTPTPERLKTETPIPTPTSTPEPTTMPSPTNTSKPTPDPTKMATKVLVVENVVAAEPDIVDMNLTDVSSSMLVTTSADPLEWRPDNDPGPPLAVQVTTNYAEPNPDLKGGTIYKVGGFVHNPTDQTYDITAINVTFYNADGFRGAFYAFPRRPGQRGIQGEWIWHGAMEADFACILLGPGESCPFTVEIAAQNMASFIVHPDAVVAEWREAVRVIVRDTQIVETGASYVRISGTANNPNPYPVKNVTISAALLDGNGQMVSLGSGIVPHIEAGASAHFDVYVEKQPYVSYELHTQAEQDVQ